MFGYDWAELNELFSFDKLGGYFEEYCLFLAFVSPLLTVRVILTLFNDTFTLLRCKFTLLSTVHIFSQLNEKSLCLAKDIYKSNRIFGRVKIVFANTDKSDVSEERSELLAEVKKINGMTTRKSVFDFSGNGIRWKRFEYYLIAEEETENVKDCIALYNDIKKANAEIYLFSTLESTALFIDSIDKTDAKAKINLINEAKLITYDLLVEHPLFEAADKMKSDVLSVVIIGGSRIAKEFAKASMWCGQMNRFGYELTVIDEKDPEIEFLGKYGDLQGKLHAIGIDNFSYNFKTVDFNSPDFLKVLSGCEKANYIVIATENDEVTINLSEKLRTFYCRKQIDTGTCANIGDKFAPLIVPIIGNMDYYDIANSFKQANDTIDYYPAGCYCDVYKYRYINNNKVIMLGKEVNKIYTKGVDTFSDLTEINKHSNIANAVHIFYKLRDAGVKIVSKSACDGETVLSDEEFAKYVKDTDTEQKLALIEHKRWCVFELLNGWDSWDLESIRHFYDGAIAGDGNTRKNEGAKYHGCITDMIKLKALAKEIFGDENYFHRQDMRTLEVFQEDFIRKLNEISAPCDEFVAIKA